MKDFILWCSTKTVFSGHSRKRTVFRTFFSFIRMGRGSRLDRQTRCAHRIWCKCGPNWSGNRWQGITCSVIANGYGTVSFCPLGPRQTGDFDEQYCDKKIKQYCDKTIFFFFVVWIENLNSWLFQLILKSNSNILSKKIAFVTKIIALSQYRFIAILLVKIAHLTRAL